MDSKSGGQTTSNRNLSADQARAKVFAAYNSVASENPSLKPVEKTSIDAAQWQQYHSAWQNYYQNYYNEYYSKAAKQYIETEKLKLEREVSDEKQIIGDTSIPLSEASDDRYDVISKTLRERLQSAAVKRAKRDRRHKRLIPFFISLAVAIFFLFLQYNRLIFAPIIAYVSPIKSGPDSIQELDPTIAQHVGPEPKLLIPKINVNVPVAFGIDNSEKTIMDAMNHGVAHFAVPGADSFPGQIGNTVITGHSAGDIYSSNPYKFIFSGLERLQNKDLIYVNYNSVRYTYAIIKKEVVLPSQVDKLSYPTDKPVLTLITCTPLGTAEKRLLVTAEQISSSDNAPARPKKPDAISDPEPSDKATQSLPKNEPSFFERVWRFFVRN